MKFLYVIYDLKRDGYVYAMSSWRPDDGIQIVDDPVDAAKFVNLKNAKKKLKDILYSCEMYQHTYIDRFEIRAFALVPQGVKE